MASTTGAQERIDQPEKPVTLQFRGKTFTLSYSQFCLLVGRQSLKQQVDDSSTKSKLISTRWCPTQGTTEEKRQLKEHLDKMYLGNERRCSRTPLYGRDLLEICSWINERKNSQQYPARINKWGWSGFTNCFPYSSTLEILKDPLQELILTLKHQKIALRDIVTRGLCVLPAVVVAPPCLNVANPPYSYIHEMKAFKFNLKEQLLPFFHPVQQIARPHFIQFPDPLLVQLDSGKMEALAILLQKLKGKGHRVLILTQMIPMLDILELFLDFHFLTYIRVDKTDAHSWHYLESIKSFNQDKRFFCAIVSSRTPSTGVSHVDVDTVVFYDIDLDQQTDTKAKEWCDRIARGRDIHIYRLVSGNSVEERLLKKGIKHLIQEVATQGDDCSVGCLTQLTPIEKYALNFLESSHTMNDQKSKKISKEFVYERPDGQVEMMPIWTPPVVPENHNDVYTDSVMCLMYSSTPMPESKLPPPFVRKARKRQRTDLPSSGERKKHCGRRIPPPSLFDQVTPGTLKARQKSKAQKAHFLVKQQMYFARPLSAHIKSAAGTWQDSPAWLISENVALLKAVKELLALPLNLAILSPAQTVNWDFVSNVVNSCNYVYRSPEQCQNHYIKTFVGAQGKNINGYPLRARQAYSKDKNSERTQIYMNHFEMMTMTARKRSFSNRFLVYNYDKLFMSEVVSSSAEPMTTMEKALLEGLLAPQLQEWQPPQKQDEGQTVEQVQTQSQPQWGAQASGSMLTPATATLQQMSTEPAVAAQPNPWLPVSFFKQKHSTA
ncbi:E1A-binding protein p400-like isoform X8 [Anas acuta]|uniref:E1A-binding protein p400-like isoform X8 n=1 Tax=Anas acuta TaxID=28680 RepID=UPI0035C8E562